MQPGRSANFLWGSIGVAQEAKLGASVVSEVSIAASRGAGEAIMR